MLVELVLGSYVLFEVNYFLRVVYVAISTKLRSRYKKKRFNEEVVSYGVCATSDLDIFFHMNNSRYLREFEFGRTTFMIATGLFPAAHRSGNKALLSAVSVRYRRSITLFQFFRVRSKVIYWTDKELYFESYLETLHDNFVRAVSLSKLTFVGPATVPQLLGSVTAKMEEAINLPEPPEMTPDLKLWVESNEASSEKLHKRN